MSTNLIICKKSIMLLTTLVSRFTSSIVILIFSIFLLVGCSTNQKLLRHNLQNDLEKKRIIEKATTREEFTITYKSPKPKNNKSYYWYRNGAIHVSNSTYEGTLINNEYTKFSATGGLQEKGNFEKGLKTGVWRTWHANGKVATVTTYKNGVKSGFYTVKDTMGLPVVSGQFKNNLKHGTWVSALKNDTLIYKKGVLKVNDTNAKKTTLFKRLVFGKKEKDSLPPKVKNVKQHKAKGSKKKAKTTTQKVNTKPSAKTVKSKPNNGSFFNRIFKKKRKNKS